MEAKASLKQTVTHLFDAVRYSNHAKELEKAAADSEDELQVEMDRLESMTEQIASLMSAIEQGSEGPVRDLSLQLRGFLDTAKQQAKERLERHAREGVEEKKKAASGERDRALKSLEAYLAADPLPVLDRTVEVKLVDTEYEAKAKYECEGGMRYEFVLAPNNSKLFHQEVTLGGLGHELRVPVRYAKTLLKGRVIGFERLDQYVMSEAEETGGKLRATFEKAGNGSRIKAVTSGSEDDAFVGLEYSDKLQSVNVMNDASLSAHVDLAGVKRATGDVVRGLEELAGKKVSLVRLSLGGEDILDSMDCYRLAQAVFDVLGPSYREIVQKLSTAQSAQDSEVGLNIQFIRERMKTLGALARPFSQSLGLFSREFPPSV